MADSNRLTRGEATDLATRLFMALTESPGLVGRIIQTRLTPQDIASFETLIGIIEKEVMQDGKRI